MERKREIASEIGRIKQAVVKPSASVNHILSRYGSPPIRSGVYLDQLLKRKELDYDAVREMQGENHAPVSAEAARQVEIEIKYEGYIEKQQREIEKFKDMEKRRIPDDFDYARLHGLSNELKEKLAAVRPASLGQASRIAGITPAALSILMIALKARQSEAPGRREAGVK
jgi:tRNA uridine 5-carboxymethylaminomethyl modification enzyme